MSKTDLFIVARRELSTYEMLKKRFADQPDVEVIMDRRRAERRVRTVSVTSERRVGQRRSTNVNGVLQQLGWVAITNDDQCSKS